MGVRAVFGVATLAAGLLHACAAPAPREPTPAPVLPKVPAPTGSALPAAASSPAAAALPTASAMPVASPTPPDTANASVAASAPAAAASSNAAHAACGMPETLVARGWRRELTPTSALETPPVAAGSTTLVVLPDIQYYASCASAHFAAQVRWAAEQKERRNVRAVLTLGDLTDHNTPSEWQYVQAGVGLVQGELPLLLVTGNHDYGDAGTAKQRRSLLSRFFPAPPGRAAEVLAESMRPGNIENAYYRITLPKVTLGVLALEWSPRSATLAWANGVLTRHAGDRVIIVTHAYLYNDGTRYDWSAKGKLQEWNPLSYGTARRDPEKELTTANLNPEGAADGEMLWNGLVKKHAGIFLVLSGHVLGSGAGVLASRGEHQNLVEQVVVNYQMLKDGGLGYLRLLELLPDGKTLRMKSFSPTLGVFANGADQAGDLALEPPLW